MKCEIHGTEMKWEGDMLTGGPVCPCCNLPDYEEETWIPTFAEDGSVVDEGKATTSQEKYIKAIGKSILRNREALKESIFKNNQLTKRLLEGDKLRQTGRTSRALYNLIKECSEENCTAVYVVHHRAMFYNIRGLLKEMKGEGIDSRQIGHDRFLVFFENMRPITLILETPQTTTILVGIKGRTAYDHFIHEEKALARRVSGDPGEGR